MQEMTNSNNSSHTWLNSRPFRIAMLLLGIGFIIIFGLMFIAVGVNLPDSWVGLIYVFVGLDGGVSGVRYYKNQHRILLIPIGAALIMAITILGGILLFGGR